MLIRNLPDESQTIRELGAVRPGQWHNVEELLATLIEVVFEGHRLLFSVHARKGRTPPKSIKVHRPAGRTGKTPPKEQTPTAELVRHFGSSGNVVVQYTPKEVD